MDYNVNKKKYILNVLHKHCFVIKLAFNLYKLYKYFFNKIDWSYKQFKNT